MKTFFAVFAVSMAVAHAASPTGEKLLEEALAQPGNFNQMCSLPPPFKADAPLKLYGLGVSREFLLSGATVKRLSEHRDEVVAALCERLQAMDLAKLPPKRMPVAQKNGAWPPDSGFDARHLSGVMLGIVMELKAVEALPALLKIEGQLSSMMVAATDPAAPIPDLEVDGIVYPRNPNGAVEVRPGLFRENPETPEKVRARALIRCQVYQRELLSVMAKLLRDADFQPLLNSPIERAYGERVREAAKDSKIKGPQDIPKEDREFVRWDEIHQVPVSIGGAQAEIPFTPEVRTQIRGFVEQYLEKK
jgi:hypothetical protein